ncbi:MAG TPA: cation diffusion facilitator family transporter [Acidimicrobiia bacterium]|nr:cation diffusion facilitator family transporter [Acidimicrobiia bacterium]
MSNHAAGDGHDHVAPPDADRRYLAVALALIVAFLVFEVVAAVVGRSLTLLADAGHMLTDVGALAASLIAARLATRPPSETHTFGLKRAEILAAAGNAITLLIVSAVVTFEAVVRLIHPETVHGAWLIVVAVVGVAVNVAATMTLSRANRRSLNVEGAFQHILTDLYAFIGTVVAGIVIVTTGFDRADPIASLVVVALMVRAAVGLLRPALRILVEATPEEVELAEVRRHILEVAEVVSVHDLHAWTLTSGLPVLSAHVVLSDGCASTGDAAQVLDRLQACLAGHFDVEHSTFQLEPIGHQEHESGLH